MEVKIGVQHANRELTVDTDQTRDALVEAIEAARKDGGLVTIDDSRGRAVAVPADKIAYLDFGQASSPKVGFGA